jgi:predicted helicase
LFDQWKSSAEWPTLYQLNRANPGERLCVVSNCRVFAEGVDVPALDAVLFAAPRTSGPDIVQIIGRAIRPHPHGTDHKALVIVPVLLPSDADDTAAGPSGLADRCSPHRRVCR